MWTALIIQHSHLYFTTFRKQLLPCHWIGRAGSSSGEPFVGDGLCYCSTVLDDIIIQGDRRESDGLKKKYSVDFQLEMDLFLQN